MKSYMGVGVLDCLFTPPSDYSPADDEAHPVSFLIQLESGVEELPAGGGVDILGASMITDFVLTEAEGGELSLSFDKGYLPGSYGVSRATFGLKSTGWKQQFPDQEGDERQYAVFKGEYVTKYSLKGVVTMVLFDYHPNMFQYRRQFGEVLALSLKFDFTSAVEGLFAAFGLSIE